jgi:hypothetical protein
MLSGIKSIISGVVGWSGSTATAADETGTDDSKADSGKEEPAKHPDAFRPVEKRDYTPEELQQFDGSVPDVAILVAIRGTIFDVSSRADIYGAPFFTIVVCGVVAHVWLYRHNQKELSQHCPHLFHVDASLGYYPDRFYSASVML